MTGAALCATAMSAPDGENATLRPVLAGKVPGSVRFVPKPEDHGYVLMKGVTACDTAMSAPEGQKATPYAAAVGVVAGSVYLVPNPLDHG